MNLFYSGELELGYPEIELTRDESMHCTRSLRLREGAQVWLTNGRGLKAEGVLMRPGDRCRIRIVQGTQVPLRKVCLQMAVAPTKNSDRFGWFVEKATELGIGKIIPMICDRSERSRIQSERIRRVMIAAMKQSERFWLPEMADETPFEDVLKNAGTGGKYIGWCGETRAVHLLQQIKKGEDALILIGPEGDFSEAEVKRAGACGFRQISLGNFRLRTETAALAACHVFNLVQEDL